MDKRPRKEIAQHDPRILSDQPEEMVTEKTVPRAGKPGIKPAPPRPRDQ